MFALPSSSIPEFAPPKPMRSTRAVNLDDEAPRAELDVVTEEVADAEEDEVAVTDDAEEAATEEAVTVAAATDDVAADAEEIVVAIGPHLTLKQLKDMCSERNLPTHGKKSELIERLR